MSLDNLKIENVSPNQVQFLIGLIEPKRAAMLDQLSRVDDLLEKLKDLSFASGRLPGSPLTGEGVGEGDKSPKKLNGKSHKETKKGNLKVTRETPAPQTEDGKPPQSGYKGVSWFKQGKSWRAQYKRADGKQKAKQGFDTPKAAAEWLADQKGISVEDLKKGPPKTKAAPGQKKSQSKIKEKPQAESSSARQARHMNELRDENDPDLAMLNDLEDL